MKHELESRLPGEISTTSEDTILKAEGEELKSVLMKRERRVKKRAENSTFRKGRSWYPVPSLHGKLMGKQWQTLLLGAPKSLQMVTAAMKLKEPWKESNDQGRQQIKKQRHYFANKGLFSQAYGFSSSHVWM